MTNAFRLTLLALSTLAASGDALAQDGQTLARVRERGYLLCGIDRSEPEYSTTDEHGSRIAFDRGICTAVAVAALGPGARVSVTYYADDSASMEALAARRADLIASVSINAAQPTGQNGPTNIGFTPPILFDPVSLMVPGSSGVTHASQLSGKLICLLTESNTQEAVESWFALHHDNLVPFPFQEEGEMEAAFVTGRCVGLAGDRTRLLQTQRDTGSMANQYALLPEPMAEDTLGVAFRLDDPSWKRIVETVRDTLLSADRLAISSQNVGTAKTSASPDVQEFLHQHRTLATTLGLSDDWALSVLQVAGNYSEIFARTFNRAASCDQLRADR